MKDKKKLGLILGAVAAVVLIVVVIITMGKGNGQPNETTLGESELTVEEAEKLLDEAFTKTIHDFPGHLIDNLDEQEHTNFVVYAEGVKRVTTDGESNVILQVDVEKLKYTISHPNEQITSLQEGDVFFMDPSANYAPGISVKVESMEVQEDQVIITGGEMTLDELIEYADVDMMLSPEKVYVAVQDDASDVRFAEEGSTDWKLDISDGAIQSMMDELQTGERLWETVDEDTEIPAENAGSSGDNEGSSGSNWLEDVYEAISWESEMTLPAYSTGDSFSFSRGRFSMRGSVQLQTSKVHVIYQYSPLVDIWRFSVDGYFDASFKASLEGKIGITMEKLIHVPPMVCPIAGPIVAIIDFSPTFDASVTLGASAGAFASCYANSSTYVYKGLPFAKDSDITLLDSDTNYSIAELNGRAAINYLTVDVKLGVPALAAMSTTIKCGSEWKGTLLKPSWTGDREESIHDCEACVKGQADSFVRLDINFNMSKLLGKKNWGTFTWTPANYPIQMPSPYDKFYVSFMQDQDPEFDFGECPHRRWRTDITVLKEGSREPVPEEVVKVTWADGNVEYEVTDEGGKATTYLPKGDNLLSAEEEESHLRGKVHAVIEDEPIEVELLLGGGKLHILFADHEQDPVIDNHDTDSWYELQEKLINMYPEAQWHHGYKLDELFADEKVSQGDIVVDITYDAPHTKYGQWNDDYLEDGDNSNIWGEGGGWIYAEISRICKDQDSGNLIAKYTFGISVSYDPARKAYLRNPQISAAQYIIKITQDVSGFYNDEYLLIGYGPREEGRETWTQDTKYIHTDYKYDTDAIRGGSRERHHLPSMMADYLSQFVGAMMDQWDLDQIMVAWE